MNFGAHVLTGSAAGVALGAKTKREIALVAMFACLPDADVLLVPLSPSLHHGAWSHTLVAVIAGTFAAIAVAFLGARLRGRRLALLAVWAGCGMTSHLVLDLFTFNQDCERIATHLYLWPISRQSFELNCLFPGATFELRIAIEIAYCAAIAAVCAGIYYSHKRRLNPRAPPAP